MYNKYGFLILLLFVVNIVFQNFKTVDWKSDGIRGGSLILPKNSHGSLTTNCSFERLPHGNVQETRLVKNKLYSITSGPNWVGLELYIRPIDSVAWRGCEYSKKNDISMISFNSSVYSFAVSPQEDLSVMITLDNSSLLTLTTINSINMSISSFSLEVNLPHNRTDYYQPFATFVDNRNLMIRLRDFERKHQYNYRFDKLSSNIRQIPTPPFSINNVFPSFSINRRSNTPHVIYYKLIEDLMVLHSYVSNSSSAENFTLDWVYSIPIGSQFIWHSDLNHVIIANQSTIIVLDAKTGNKVDQMHGNYFGSPVVGGSSSFYIRELYEIREYIFDRKLSNYSSRWLPITGSVLSIIGVSKSGEISYQYTSGPAIYNPFTRREAFLKFNQYTSAWIPSDLFIVTMSYDGSYQLYTYNERPIPSPTKPSYIDYHRQWEETDAFIRRTRIFAFVGLGLFLVPIAFYLIVFVVALVINYLRPSVNQNNQQNVLVKEEHEYLCSGNNVIVGGDGIDEGCEMTVDVNFNNP